MTNIPTSAHRRLEGLDIARFLAFVGMVVVNFKTAMGSDGVGSSWLAAFAGAFEGRAAATFVVLAGLGLGLSAVRGAVADTVTVTLKRALFLLVLGLLNAIIFEADILHYYAFYFLFGMMFLRASSTTLMVAIVMVVAGFVIALLIFDYDQGWDWENLTYTGFWEPMGMARNLLFNGWHPVLPWLAFFLFGILLSRINLQSRQTLVKLAIGGVLSAASVEILSGYVTMAIGPSDPEEIAILFTTKPVPPMPLYMMAGMSVATAVISLCLLAEDWFRRTGVLKAVAPAGRQTLTLYIAHVMIGMGILDALDMLSGKETINSAVMSAIVFSIFATVYAYLWSRRYKRGPIEALMRKLAG